MQLCRVGALTNVQEKGMSPCQNIMAFHKLLKQCSTRWVRIRRKNDLERYVVQQNGSSKVATIKAINNPMEFRQIGSQSRDVIVVQVERW